MIDYSLPNGPPNDLRQELMWAHNDYVRDYDRRPSIWNTPSAREEAGRHLSKLRPWESFYSVAVLNCSYWQDVQALILQAIGSVEPLQALKGGAL